MHRSYNVNANPFQMQISKDVLNKTKLKNIPKNFIKPSFALLDPLPNAPSARNPNQCVIGRIDRPALKLYLQILASSDTAEKNVESAGLCSIDQRQDNSRDISKLQRQSKPRELGDKVVHFRKHRPTKQNHYGKSLSESEFNQILIQGICSETRLMVVEHRLNLADIRPLKAPFVPDLLNILVNSIETECHTDGWEPMFLQFPQLKKLAQNHACIIIQNWNHPNHLKRQIASLHLPLKIVTLRIILSSFNIKPLHFSRRLLMGIIKRPLFDQFLRPNPNIKSLVRHTVLPTNRTTMDTMAFLMFHLLHAWECASNPLTAKLKLAKLYGPLLVSFAERPVILDQDPTDYKLEEAAILEVVLEVCNSQFWDNLSMLQLRSIFTSKKPSEKSRPRTQEGYERTTTDTIPTTNDYDDSEYENEMWFSYLFPHNKTSSFRQTIAAADNEVTELDINRYVDCRVLAREQIVKRKVKETEEETVTRYKNMLGLALHGNIMETGKPRIKIPTELLTDGQFRNFYIERPLRSTGEILNHIKESSRLMHQNRDSRYSKVNGKVQKIINRTQTLKPYILSSLE